MRIVMIGHSNAGKTTYMSLMYRYMRKGHKGFTIRAQHPEHDEALRTDATRILAGHYPPPSSRRDSYEFVLSHRSTAFFTFTWHDYRGGALSERTTEPEVAQVMNDLGSADGIIVFADAHQLANDGANRREVQRLVTLTQRAVDARQSRVPLVIAYTKADLVKRDRDRLRAAEPLAALAEAARGSQRIDDTSVWVACTRRPKNVAVPVLWCLAYGVSNRIADLEASAAANKSEADFEWGKASIRDSWQARRQGTVSHAKRSALARRAAQRDLAELEPLRAPADKLVQAVRRTHRG